MEPQETPVMQETPKNKRLTKLIISGLVLIVIAGAVYAYISFIKYKSKSTDIPICLPSSAFKGSAI